MGALETIFSKFKGLSNDLRGEERNGNILLADLVGSTDFKTRHPEHDWLIRLDEFYQAVERALAPDRPTKFLGDGVFAFYEDDIVDAFTLLAKARGILEKIDELNTSGKFPGDHAIRIRIILNSGSVYLFSDHDPQGNAVDKLFRMEKFVPEGFIGMTEEFVKKAGLTELKRVGRFSLKGLAAGRHALYLDEAAGGSVSQRVAELQAESAATELWWLAGTGDQLVYLVGGYIPPAEEPSSLVQMGDKDAFVEALFSLARAGDIRKVRHYDSSDFPHSEISGNIVCIGGPCFNSVTRRLMEDAKLPIQFEGIDEDDDGTPLINADTGERFEKSYDEKHRLVRDWGFFARFKNPHNKDATVIIACGIESPAVDGIVRVFSSQANPHFNNLYERLMDTMAEDLDDGELPEFCCIMPFKIEEATRIAVTPSFEDQTRRIIGLKKGRP